MYALVSAGCGAVAGYALADSLHEGAIAGAVVGASLGLIVAARRNARMGGVSFELEAAGLADDNLITIARRDLSRDAYRDSYDLRERDSQVKAMADAAGKRIRETDGQGLGTRESEK